MLPLKLLEHHLLLFSVPWLSSWGPLVHLRHSHWVELVGIAHLGHVLVGSLEVGRVLSILVASLVLLALLLCPILWVLFDWSLIMRVKADVSLLSVGIGCLPEQLITVIFFIFHIGLGLLGLLLLILHLLMSLVLSCFLFILELVDFYHCAGIFFFFLLLLNGGLLLIWLDVLFILNPLLWLGFHLPHFIGSLLLCSVLRLASLLHSVLFLGVLLLDLWLFSLIDSLSVLLLLELLLLLLSELRLVSSFLTPSLSLIPLFLYPP